MVDIRLVCMVLWLNGNKAAMIQKSGYEDNYCYANSRIPCTISHSLFIRYNTWPYHICRCGCGDVGVAADNPSADKHRRLFRTGLQVTAKADPGSAIYCRYYAANGYCYSVRALMCRRREEQGTSPTSVLPVPNCLDLVHIITGNKYRYPLKSIQTDSSFTRWSLG